MFTKIVKTRVERNETLKHEMTQNNTIKYLQYKEI